jgi:hypothetical protein
VAWSVIPTSTAIPVQYFSKVSREENLWTGTHIWEQNIKKKLYEEQ